jgi:hypothetical protein
MSSSANTLFKPITVGSEKSGANVATTSINTFTSTIPSTTTTTTTTTTTSTTTVTAPIVSSTTTTTTQKENIRYIPPVFFIGATGANVDSQDQDVNRAGSIGALEGDRRLSKVFNEVIFFLIK